MDTNVVQFFNAAAAKGRKSNESSQQRSAKKRLNDAANVFAFCAFVENSMIEQQMLDGSTFTLSRERPGFF